MRATDERHPLLYGVSSGRVSVLQTAVMDLDANRTGLTPLWLGPAGPILAAGELGKQRVVLLAAAPTLSESLPLTSAYPLLLGNAIYWAARSDGDDALLQVQRTGALVELPEDATLLWAQDDTATSPVGVESQASPAATRWEELHRVGFWEAGGEAGSAAVLSERETRLSPVSASDVEPADAATRSRWLSGDLVPPLLWLTLGVLLIESYLFHRHRVY